MIYLTSSQNYKQAQNLQKPNKKESKNLKINRLKIKQDLRTWRRKAKEEKEKEMLLFDWNFRCWLRDKDAHCSSSLSQTIPKPLIMLSQNEKKKKAQEHKSVTN